MSHEVNNSVRAIGSTLNVVADIFKQDGSNKWEYVLPAIEASFDRCGHLASFISNLAQVIRIPEPTFPLISLNEQAGFGVFTDQHRMPAKKYRIVFIPDR